MCCAYTFTSCCVPRISLKNQTDLCRVKDGGTLRTIREACDYVTAHGGKQRESCALAGIYLDAEFGGSTPGNRRGTTRQSSTESPKPG